MRRTLGVEDPGVFTPATLGGVHDDGAALEGHAGEATRENLYGIAPQYERTEVDVTALESTLNERRVLGKVYHGLGDVVAWRGDNFLAELFNLCA